MVDVFFEDDEPCYVISVVAKLVDMHPQTLRYYERVGLIKPSRTAGRIRMYSQRDIDSLRQIARITEELGVKNLAGVEVIINMNQRIEELQQQLAELQQRYTEEVNAMLVKIQAYEALLNHNDQTGPSLSGKSRRLIPG